MTVLADLSRGTELASIKTICIKQPGPMWGRVFYFLNPRSNIMGQYWVPVNITKKEYVDPYKLGSGLKLCEYLKYNSGPGAALIILLAAMPERRGGGDLAPDPIIGRWAGDQIAIVGDYAEDSDLPNSPVPASKIYNLCDSDPEWVDVSDDVCRVIERELNGKFTDPTG